LIQKLNLKRKNRYPYMTIKRIYVSMGISLLFFSICGFAFSDNISNLPFYELSILNGTSIENNEFTALERVDDICNGLPYHDMVSHGYGWVSLGAQGSTWYINRGSCFQCSGCYTVVITQWDPTIGLNIGKYGIDYTVNYPINITGAALYNTQYYGVENSNLMPGFRFR